MLTVQKMTLRCGLDPNAVGVMAGYPSAIFGRSGGLVPNVPASWSAAIRPIPSGAIAFTDVMPSRKLAPMYAGQGPVTAVAIAADCPFDTVDMVIDTISERSVHRIAVGAPYLGTIPTDADVWFAIPDAVPLIVRVPGTDAGGSQSARADLTQLWWDCYAPVVAGNGLSQLLYPIRLDVYRGGVPPVATARGVYAAHASFEIVDVGAGVASQPQLVVLTHGRRRVRVTAGIWAHLGAAANVRVDGVVGRKGTSDDGAQAPSTGDRIDVAAYDPLLADTPITAMTAAGEGAPTVFDYQGNPYFAHVVTITGGAIGTRGHFDVEARDA